MTISVVMAVHNQLRTLPAALDSILGQTLKDWELILIADGCDTETELYLVKYSHQDSRIKLIINRKHLGLTKSLNKGIKIAKGKYIARMDADDEALPSRFTKQVEYLNSHRQVKLLGTAANLIDADGKPLGIKRFASDHEHLRQAILSYCPFIHPTWMLRRSVLDEVGTYNEAFPYAQDYELALRIVSHFPTANLLDPLLNYRVNSAAAISLKHLKQQEWLALKARFLALAKYGYSITESWRLIKPLLSFLVPAGIKKSVYARFYW